MVVYYAITTLAVILQYGSSAIPPEMWRSFLFACYYTLAMLAFAFMMSALLKSPAASMNLTFFGMMILLPILNRLRTMIDLDSSWIFTNYSSLIIQVFRFPSETFGPFASDLLDFYSSVKLLFVETLLFFFTAMGVGLSREV